MDRQQWIVLHTIPCHELYQAIEQQHNLLVDATSEFEGNWITIGPRLHLKVWKTMDEHYSFKLGSYLEAEDSLPKYWIPSTWEFYSMFQCSMDPVTELPYYQEDITLDKLKKAMYLQLGVDTPQSDWLTCPTLLYRILRFIEKMNIIRKSLVVAFTKSIYISIE